MFTDSAAVYQIIEFLKIISSCVSVTGIPYYLIKNNNLIIMVHNIKFRLKLLFRFH